VDLIHQSEGPEGQDVADGVVGIVAHYVGVGQVGNLPPALVVATYLKRMAIDGEV